MIVSQTVLGVAWKFPTPAGHLFNAVVGFSVACPILFYMIMGRNLLKKDVIKRVAPLIAVSVLPVMFLFMFFFYRVLFNKMNSAEQAMFAPLWPILKIGLKALASKLIELGENPDAGPFLLFVFDSVSALAGNFLFMSANSVSSVLTMISIDVIENLVLAIRVILFMQVRPPQFPPC